jgi:hypothetical protein
MSAFCLGIRSLGYRQRVGVCLLGILCGLGDAAAAQNDGVCARVALRLDQSAVMTRTAFRATLELSNHDPASSLSSISLQVEIRDTGGKVVNSRFQIEEPTLENIDRLDGTGTISANGTATIRWLLIPAEDAALNAPTEFFVGGHFSYALNGNQVQVPLEGVRITVYPDAALDLQYFHERDVFSDDPFTAEVEPAQPYALAVLVKNRGAGAAKSLKIGSGQPQIVSNEKGLLIDFTLIGASLEGTNTANSLALDFGRIEPSGIKIAEWRFISSLQGFFRDFNATFQHEDTLGSQRLSTIKSVSIHEMTHLVEAGYQFADSRPDFLVNDAPDPGNLPDTLYFSDGSTNQVQLVQEASVLGLPLGTNLQAQLIVPMPAGWTYVRIQDPSAGRLLLTRVTRSDGVEIKVGANVWTTDRTFTNPGKRPRPDPVLHLLDYNSPGTYTLNYSRPPVPDTTSPATSVEVLPGAGPINFPVQWRGQDDVNGSGIAYFDIFVSSNREPFQIWLQHTTLNGALYSGKQGDTYAFYSVATDLAGNHEPPPGAPDTQTTISVINHAPTLTGLTNLSVNEGQEFTLALTATDADLPVDTLTFGLGADAPPGMTIDSNTGNISWFTSEANGPGTNTVTVVVSDNGVPSRSDSRSFTLVVNEVNQPPTLASIPNRAAVEGQVLIFDATASDSDLPANTLLFSLMSGAPAGARIDSATGSFTWMPPEEFGGTTNRIGVKVTDDGGMSATQIVTIVVSESNSPPTWTAISDRTVDEGSELSFVISAFDTDLPANHLKYSLGPDAPAGATVDATTGHFLWTPSEAQGPSTNAIKVIATDDGVPSLSATTTAKVWVKEVNSAPTLTAVPSQVAFIQALLLITNVTTDADVPTNSFAFRLEAGAPRGASIGTNSGIFSFQPSRSQAGSSNPVTVVVTDNGVPPLSATNTFNVIVPDFVEVSLGSALLQVGETATFPIIAYSTAFVTNLSFAIHFPGHRFTNLTLVSQTALGSLQPISHDSSALEFQARAGLNLQSTQVLSLLQFTALTNQISAFVPLLVSDLHAISIAGQPVPRSIVHDGRVVVIGSQPLLEGLVSSNGSRFIYLYGKPGTSYVMESSLRVNPPILWEFSWEWTLTNLSHLFDLSSDTNGMILYRAREL